MREIFIDSVVDCVKLLPFLYLSYLVVEYAEHRMSQRTKELIYQAGKAGPLLGALIGIIPQCGFSAGQQACLPAVWYLREHCFPYFYLLRMKCFRLWYRRESTRL